MSRILGKRVVLPSLAVKALNTAYVCMQLLFHLASALMHASVQPRRIVIRRGTGPRTGIATQALTLRGALLRSRAAAARRGISNATMVLLGQSPAAQQLEESRDGGLAACNLAMRLCGGSAPSAYRPPLPRRSHVSPGVVSASAGGGRSQLRCGAPCKHGACSRTDTRTLCLRGHRRWSDDRRRSARAFGPGIVGLVASPALAWVCPPLFAHHAARTLEQPTVVEVTEQTVAPEHAPKLALSMRTNRAKQQSCPG